MNKLTYQDEILFRNLPNRYPGDWILQHEFQLHKKMNRVTYGFCLLECRQIHEATTGMASFR